MVEDSPVEDSPAESGELNGKGYRVVRFWKIDIPGNLKGVLESVAEALHGTAAHPHPIPLPSRERECQNPPFVKRAGKANSFTRRVLREHLWANLSDGGPGDGELRRERMACAVPPLGASGSDIRRK